MSKTSELADHLKRELDGKFAVDDVSGKTIKMHCVSEDYDFSQLRDGVEITFSGPGIRCQIGGRFAFLAKGEDVPTIAKKTVNTLLKTCTKRSEDEVKRNVHMELCDYVTSKLVESGFSIVNKGCTIEGASYAILGPSRTKYLIKAKYTSEIVEVFVLSTNHENYPRLAPSTLIVGNYNLADPHVEEVICKALVDYDRGRQS